MIAIESAHGKRIKQISTANETYTFHHSFGFVPENLVAGRVVRRKRQGLKVRSTNHPSVCRFSLQSDDKGFAIEALEGCEAQRSQEGVWTLTTARGEFRLRTVEGAQAWAQELVIEDSKDSALWAFGIVALLLFVATIGLAWFFAAPEKAVEAQIIQPVQVTVVPDQPKVQQHAVTVPPSALPQLTDARLQGKETKRAIAQNLGFLGMLGKKNLKNAVGGMPTSLKDASAGAGPGGKEGSGGEMLVGLGAGVRRATVGNTGTVGLGGIGTKGVGGGAGGYGNTMIGSGEGRALSKVAALSGDMVLEGGLDRAVIQATIAKYLSQVRSCYEEQLQSNAGLAGQVTVGFVINGGGDVASSQLASSTLGNAKAESCIVTKLKSWKFPKPVGGVNVKVNYPFLLRPVGT